MRLRLLTLATLSLPLLACTGILGGSDDNNGKSSDSGSSGDCGLVGCGDADTDSDSDSDSDSDADSDSDSDADSDADADADGDADADSDADADTDADAVNAADLVGRVYDFNLAAATIEEPAGIGSLIGSYLQQDMLVMVTSVKGSTLPMLVGLSAVDSGGNEQDLCAKTYTTTADFADNPAFSTDADGTISPNIAGSTVDVTDVALVGTFAADESSIEDAEVIGLFDTRGMDEQFGGGEGAMCDLMPSFGEECQKCDDGKYFCLPFHATNISAPWVKYLELDTVTKPC